jgi:hypothetical protein
MAASGGDPMHIGMLWHPNQAYAERREPDILGTPWRDLPLEVRRAWWKATSYGEHEPSPEFMASLPELLVVEQSKREVEKREAAAEAARVLAELRQARELCRKWFPSRMRQCF